MKTAGWIFVVIGVLAFLGAAAKGNSVFGPSVWIAIGGALLYFKREREENKEKKVNVVPEPKKVVEQLPVTENQIDNETLEQTSPITFEQKEAALCLIAFFAGYNDDIATNENAQMVSYQSGVFFEIDNYKETLTAAMPKYQDADKLMDTVLSIKDRKAREFILLTCYDLTKMSGKVEAYGFLYNIADEMGYSKEKLQKLVEQYS